MAIESAAGFVRMTRTALAAAGFVRKERAGMVTFEAGEGDTVVLIHGANDHAGTWFAIAPVLARTHRVVVPDLPGHGESEPHAGPIAISRVVSALESLIDTPATLVGNSFGGWMSLIFAHRHPERVQQLVLESSGGLNRPTGVPLFAQTREQAIPILRAVHGPQYEPQEWVIEALLQRAVDSPMLRLTELLEHDIEPHLGEIETKATLIWGRDDGVLPLSYAQGLLDALPNASLQIIDGAAHIPHLQQPERFLQCLTAIF